VRQHVQRAGARRAHEQAGVSVEIDLHARDATPARGRSATAAVLSSPR
jgi:hypothetical protein